MTQFKRGLTVITKDRGQKTETGPLERFPSNRECSDLHLADGNVSPRVVVFSAGSKARVLEAS